MKQVFPMIPAGSAAYTVFAVICAVMLLLFLLFVYLAWTARHATFEVSEDGLAIHGGMYGRTISAAALDVQHARATDLAADLAHAPSWRTNGVGMPGYSGGWFQLQDGERALAFITDRRHVAYIPTHQGYAVLLSVADPDALVRALQQSVPR